MTAELNRDRNALNAAKAEAETYATQLDTLETEINEERPYINNRSQAAIDGFNQKVDRYNALLQAQKVRNNRINQMVDAYNATLERHGH